LLTDFAVMTVVCMWCTEACLYHNPADWTAIWRTVWLARCSRLCCWLS